MAEQETRLERSMAEQTRAIQQKLDAQTRRLIGLGVALVLAVLIQPFLERFGG